MSSAIAALGVTLKCETGSPLTYTEVPELIDFDFGGIESEEIDVSNLNTSSNLGFREFIMGLKDPGEATFTFNWIPGNAVHEGLWDDANDQTSRNWQLIVSTQTFAFAAYVRALTINGDPSSQVTASMTLRKTGAVTLT